MLVSCAQTIAIGGLAGAIARASAGCATCFFSLLGALVLSDVGRAPPLSVSRALNWRYRASPAQCRRRSAKPPSRLRRQSG